ncbi:MAG: M15 family metallopeptidase [Flavobacteriaceae bacterium]|nr:M15 family metallopeptidase [Flavobacteriaceae bacterium]MDH3795727.1 M15 family metallopeptidase [Flavobacteriaceae bacterium]
MMGKRLILILGVLLLSISCKEEKKAAVQSDVVEKEILLQDSIKITMKMPKVETPSLTDLSDTLFVRLADYNADFQYDMRYATENNFLKAKVYDCAECYTRVKTAKALIAANNDFLKSGYRIKFFDCYRPNDVQYKMWEIVPNPQYVADPVKGSIHNKGGAVDITLVDMNGQELDMGTDFDFFGRRAYHDNLDLPEAVLSNRKILKETMEKHGFWSIRTEWWHYNLSAASNDPVANFTWPCPTSIN